MNRAKVLFIEAAQLEQVLRGVLAIRNFPGGGVIAAVQPMKVEGEPGFALRVHSETYPPVCHGEQLPVVRATFFSKGDRDE